MMVDISPAAWVIILTAAATYIALWSSWLMSLPAQRAAVLQGNITAIEADLSAEPLLRSTQERVIQNMKQRVAATAGTDRRLIARGRWLLFISLVLFTTALVIQIRTDNAFKQDQNLQKTSSN
jgi:hypothetical protein